jgi:hypothetical protein
VNSAPDNCIGIGKPEQAVWKQDELAGVNVQQ